MSTTSHVFTYEIERDDEVFKIIVEQYDFDPGRRGSTTGSPDTWEPSEGPTANILKWRPFKVTGIGERPAPELQLSAAEWESITEALIESECELIYG